MDLELAYLLAGFEEMKRKARAEIMSEGAEEMPKGAERVTASLDLLTDEPLELAVALEKLAKIKAAGGSNSDEWQAFVDHLDGLVAALQELNEPSQKRAKDEASEKT